MGNYSDFLKLVADADPYEEQRRVVAARAAQRTRDEQLGRLSGIESEIPEASLEGAPVQVGESQMDSPEAQAMRQQQLRALARLQQISEEGYTDTDKAAMNDALSDVNQQERGNRLAIQQRMNPNSGAAIAAQLSNNQAANQRANAQGLQVAGQSRARALSALGQYGDMASGIRNQEMGVGQANDAISKFNATNSIGAGSRNADRRGAANRFAYGSKVGNFNTRVGLQDNNTQELRDEENRKFARNRRIAEGAGGVMDDVAAYSQSGDGGGGGGGGGQNYMELLKMFKGGE